MTANVTDDVTQESNVKTTAKDIIDEDMGENVDYLEPTDSPTPMPISVPDDIDTKIDPNPPTPISVPDDIDTKIDPADSSSSAVTSAALDNSNDPPSPPPLLPEKKSVNYASTQSGALVLETSPNSKGMGNILLDDKDKYAISPCDDKKWVVIGLSEDILVKELIIANYEKYSSIVNEFQVLGSQTFPTQEWRNLGTLGANFTQGEQKFQMLEPAWARYLKLRFLSHHGMEFYCTISQVKVHGSTMLEGFAEQWEEGSKELVEIQNAIEVVEEVVEGEAADANVLEGEVLEGDLSEGTKVEEVDQEVADESVEEATPAIVGDVEVEEKVDNVEAAVIENSVVEGSPIASDDDDERTETTTEDNNVEPRHSETVDLIANVGSPAKDAAVAVDEAIDGAGVDAAAEDGADVVGEIKESENAGSPKEQVELPGKKMDIDNQDPKEKVPNESNFVPCEDKVDNPINTDTSLNNTDSDSTSTSTSTTTTSSAVTNKKLTVNATNTSSNVGKTDTGTADEVGSNSDRVATALSGSTLGENSSATAEDSLENVTAAAKNSSNTVNITPPTTTEVTPATATPQSNTTNITNISSIPNSTMTTTTTTTTTTTATTTTTSATNATASLLSCMESLNYGEFKKMMLSRSNKTDALAKKMASPSFAAATSGGQLGMENIFKTLMNEIKTLQLNQSIFQSYINSMQNCYDTIFREMENERLRSAAESERLLTNLAAEIRELQLQSNLIINPFYLRKISVDAARKKLELDEDSLLFGIVNCVVTSAVFLLFVTAVWNLKNFDMQRRNRHDGWDSGQESENESETEEGESDCSDNEEE